MIEHLRVDSLAGFEEQWHFSHVVRARGLLFLSGVTGIGEDGTLDADPGTQFRQAFEHLGLYLEAGGARFADVVEMTSYHVDLRATLEVFMAVKDEYIVPPFPAWSAIGCSDLITAGALVEIRAVALEPNG